VLPAPSPEEIVQAIEKLGQEPDRVRTMGRNAYRAFRERYTLAHAARRYDALLHDVIYGGLPCAVS